MRNDFLSELADRVIRDHRDHYDRLKIVFPNRRAGMFFTRALSKKIDAPVWSPAILSIEDFICSYSDLIPAENLTLLLELYEVFQEKSPVKETFDRFYFWGDMLLRDFDEIDKYLVNPEDLFSTLKNMKEIDARFQYFSDEQLEALKSFWSSAIEHPTDHKKNFLVFWQTLIPVYKTFKEKIGKKKFAYQGMIYREVYRKLFKEEIAVDHHHVIFAGFYALNRAEEKIIKWFVKNRQASLYWDIDRYYFDDPAHEAGHFLRKYYSDTDFRPFFPEKLHDHIRQGSRNIETIASSQYTTQTRIAGTLIRDMIEETHLEELEDTVVVLPDDSLLSLLLYSLPSEVNKINITMGYPIRNSAFFSLFNNMLEMQEKIRAGKSMTWFNHRNVLNILNHPFIRANDNEKGVALISKIKRHNIIHVPLNIFHDDPVLNRIFRKIGNEETVFDYLIDILAAIRNSFDQDQSSGYIFEKEFALVYYRLFNRLKEVFSSRPVHYDAGVVRRVVRSYAQFEKIPFTGEPLEGLQIMGLLETRNLDFKNVIVLCTNEGFIPGTGGQASFIPYNVRRAFELPLPENSDSIYSYLFYRLIQRAGKVHLIYNTEDAYNRKAEPSRYIYQLNFDSGVEITGRWLSNDIASTVREPIILEKNGFINERLNRYVAGKSDSQKHFTPSALNQYLDCPLTFCYKHIFDIREKDEVIEDLEAAKFGLILHRAMEYLYRPLLGKDLTEGSFKLLHDRLEESVNRSFAEYHGFEDKPGNFRFEGKNILGREIIMKYIGKILERDLSSVPFRIVGIEKPYKYSFPVQTGQNTRHVSLKGVIDRIDLKGDVIRIIDYKSGKDTSSFRSLEELFDPESNYRNKAVFQTFFYALLYLRNHTENPDPVVSGLYNFSELHSEDFDVRIKFRQPGGKPGLPVTDIRPHIEEFETLLSGLIREIFDPKVPFSHHPKADRCIYCESLGMPSDFE